jgi:hypothetical protein
MCNPLTIHLRVETSGTIMRPRGKSGDSPDRSEDLGQEN